MRLVTLLVLSACAPTSGFLASSDPVQDTGALSDTAEPFDTGFELGDTGLDTDSEDVAPPSELCTETWGWFFADSWNGTAKPVSGSGAVVYQLVGWGDLCSASCDQEWAQLLIVEGDECNDPTLSLPGRVEQADLNSVSLCFVWSEAVEGQTAVCSLETDGPTFTLTLEG